MVLKRDPLSSAGKKLSLAKLTNGGGYAATSRKDHEGGYAKSNLYNGDHRAKAGPGGYADPASSRQLLLTEEGS